ncbi:MAG: APC family permease [Polyangiales bacterium]
MRRSLGLFDVTCIGLNAIVGSGIFVLPDDLYREMGGLSPLAFVLCALGLLPVALCYSEAASTVDRTGGPYIYAGEAFGPRVGFAVGWMCFANSIFSFAAVSSAAAAYVGRLVPALAPALAMKTVALVVIATFALINYRGARPGALAIDMFTVGKFAVLLILVSALVPHVSFARFETPLPHGMAGVGAATFMAVFAAQGFEVAPVTAGETHAPERKVPIAVLSSMLAASALYVAVQATLVGAYGRLHEVSDTPLADAALSVVPALGLVVTIGGLVSTLGFVSGSALGTPRYLFAAAEDGHLPSALAAVHARFESPHKAVVATALLAMALAIPFDYRSLIGMSNVAVAVQYLGTCLAVLKLRSRPHTKGFRIPLGPVVPLLGAAVSVWVFTQASQKELGWATASLAVGLLTVAVNRRMRGAPRAS